MSGYTTAYHIDTIKALIANGHFDGPSGKMSLTLAIHDLDIHFRYGNICEDEYNDLVTILHKKQNNRY